MGKGTGLWVPCYGEAFEHDKLLDLAEHIHTWLMEQTPDLFRSAGVPEYLRPMAIDTAVACLCRAHIALLERFSPNGHFTIPRGQEHRFVPLAWPSVPGHYTAPDLLEWFLDVGLAHVVTEGRRKTTYRLHEYEEHNREILRKRPSYNDFCKQRDRAAEGPAPRAAEPPAEGPAEPPAPRAATGPGRRDSKTARQLDGIQKNPSDSSAVPVQKLCNLWNETKARYRTRWVEHRKVPSACEPQLRARWKEIPDLAIWRIAMEAAAQDEHWGGRKPSDRYPKGWRAGISSFVRDEHFARWVTEAKESDWRYAADEDLAWEAWFESVKDGALEARDVAYEGAWPTDGDLTPRQQDQAEAELRKWWRTAIYENRETLEQLGAAYDQED